MIRLQGGFEVDEYWTEVRQTGNDRLKEFGYEDWVVTLRPLTLTDSERSGSHGEEWAVDVSAAAKTLDIAVIERPELPPQSFVQTTIIDVIDQSTDARGDDAFGNLFRDEGGEA